MFVNVGDFPRGERGREQRELIHAAVKIAHSEVGVGAIDGLAPVADGRSTDGDGFDEILLGDGLLTEHTAIEIMRHRPCIDVVSRCDHEPLAALRGVPEGR